METNSITFTTAEIKLMQKHALFSQIGDEIPSSRARLNGTISPKYVSDVCKGRVTRVNDTTAQIKHRAKELLTALKIKTNEI